LFSNIPTVVPSIYPILSNAPDYTNLPFFNNWIVGFTECKEFAGYVEYKKNKHYLDVLNCKKNKHYSKDTINYLKRASKRGII